MHTVRVSSSWTVEASGALLRYGKHNWQIMTSFRAVILIVDQLIFYLLFFACALGFASASATEPHVTIGFNELSEYNRDYADWLR